MEDGEGLGEEGLSLGFDVAWNLGLVLSMRLAGVFRMWMCF